MSEQCPELSPDPKTVDDSRIMLLRKDSGEMIPSAPSGSVLLSSAPFGWRGIVLETHRLEPQELPEHLVQGHQLSVHTGRPLDFEYHSDGRWRRVKMFPGALSLVTNTAPSYPRWSEPYEFVKLSLDPTFVAKVLQDTAHSPSIAFVERRGVEEPQVERLVLLLRDELRGGSLNGPLFVESLATALVTHLWTHHAASPVPRERVPEGGLPPFALRRVLEYLDANLTRDVSLGDLAGVAHVSPYHFARQFKRSLGVAPHQYLVQRRVERARALLISASEMSLAQIAAAVGFYDQSHLSHHVKRLLGSTPAVLRKVAHH